MASSLTITDARYVKLGGYPALRLSVNGRKATLITECKPTLRAAGIVFLGDEFADVVPPIDFVVPDSNGDVLRLEGFTKDPRVFQLYDEFGRACNDGSFKPGPVAIPA